MLGARARAIMPVGMKNFSLAKIQDSESTHSAVNYVAGLARTLSARSMRRTCIKENAAAQAFPAILISGDADGAGISRIEMRARRCIIARCARRARIIACQLFFNGDAVFFDYVAVFERKCTSIPECTQQLKAISLHQEGNMAKKAKKAKKAKSAVKKTAKKTRKVSKKKK